MSTELVSNDIFLVQALIPTAPTNSANLEAIDWGVLATLEEIREDGEPDLIVELIDLYIGDAPHWIEAIRIAVAGNDAPMLKRAAHSLKGSSGSLGVRQVAETCRMLELNCSDSAGKVEELLQILNREFAAACDALVAERTRRLG